MDFHTAAKRNFAVQGEYATAAKRNFVVQQYNVMETVFYYRNLPHYQPSCATFFVTYRLAGSLPVAVINRLKQEFRQQCQVIQKNGKPRPSQKEAIYIQRKRYFAKFDEHLHRNMNEPYWLRDENLAKIVADSLHFLAQEYFDLWAYCIMSNHVHILISLFPAAPRLYKVMQKHKRSTAIEGNKVLRRTGQFWARESYDHVVRKDGEFGRILAYILNNPVKAGLVEDWQAWQGSYLNPKL